MHDAITRYFAGEKLGALCLLALGLIAMSAVALLWRSNYRGALLPLGLVGLVQLGVGVGLYLRTEPQVVGLRAQLDRAPAEYKALEGQRMQKVMRSFVAIELVEVLLLAAGIALAVLFKQRPGLFAAGLGIIWQSAVMLLFDLLAEQRGRHYVEAIERLLS